MIKRISSVGIYAAHGDYDSYYEIVTDNSHWGYVGLLGEAGIVYAGTISDLESSPILRDVIHPDRKYRTTRYLTVYTRIEPAPRGHPLRKIMPL